MDYKMLYSTDDKNYIKKLLNNCIQLNSNNEIYFITSNNITRQLKYNRILKINKIKLNLNNIYIPVNVLLKKDLINKRLYVNSNKIWLYFYSKYNLNWNETNNFINKLMSDILNLDEYIIYQFGRNEKILLRDIIK